MAKKPDGWDLLKEGRYDEAIPQFYDEYQKEGPSSIGSESALVGVSLAFLLKREPETAAEVAESILTRKHIGTGHYALAGTAQWIGGSYERSVELWKKGIGSQYADASGGMELPLLLFYAAVRKPNLIKMGDVTDLVKQQLCHPWVMCWPGPLGAL
jgi:hypothetical protein